MDNNADNNDNALEYEQQQQLQNREQQHQLRNWHRQQQRQPPMQHRQQDEMNQNWTDSLVSMHHTSLLNRMRMNFWSANDDDDNDDGEDPGI